MLGIEEPYEDTRSISLLFTTNELSDLESRTIEGIIYRTDKTHLKLKVHTMERDMDALGVQIERRHGDYTITLPYNFYEQLIRNGHAKTISDEMEIVKAKVVTAKEKKRFAGKVKVA